MRLWRQDLEPDNIAFAWRLSFDFKLGLQGLTLQNFLNFEKQLRDYRNSTVADLQTWTIADYSTAIPPYRQQHEYYAFCDYDVDTQTISESENIAEVKSWVVEQLGLKTHFDISIAENAVTEMWNELWGNYQDCPY